MKQAKWILLILILATLLSISDGVITYFLVRNNLALEINPVPKMIQYNLGINFWFVLHVSLFLIIGMALYLGLRQNQKFVVKAIILWIVIEIIVVLNDLLCFIFITTFIK